MGEERGTERERGRKGEGGEREEREQVPHEAEVYPKRAMDS